MPALSIAQSLHVGIAEVDITPPDGFPMAGYYHERLATGRWDPLHAKAVVLREGETACCFVVADLTGVSRDLYEQVRRRAAEKTGIQPEHIVLSATHSHTAPDYYNHLTQFLSSDPNTRAPDAYVSNLIDACVRAIEQADDATIAVEALSGIANQQTPVAFNRRFVMRDGSVKTWQSFSSPQVVRSAGPIDPRIGLLMFRSTNENKPLGLISNFALHLDTVGGTKWSADFPFYIEKMVREAIGDGVVSIFGAGTCGDINHSDPSRKERNKTDRIGTLLGETVVAALPDLQPIPSPKLQVLTTTVNLPLQQVTDEQLKRAEQLIPAAEAGEKIDFFDLVAAHKAVILHQLREGTGEPTSEQPAARRSSLTWAGIGDSLPVDVTTITLGDQAAIVFLPGEVFVELGLAIKQGSPYANTLVIELSNCVETMYIPTRAAYAGGGYEVVNSAVEPGSGEMLVEAALKLLRQSASPQP
ncbi:MAG: neutral/alkaline non-lysosomal ceramidase N-terminal domain-containing protein [Pirellulaceae bacterium]